MKFKCIKIKQGKREFYSFTCKASVLWGFSEINQRQEDKDEGYQRVLSSSRVNKIKNFIASGNAIPGAIIISLDSGNIERNHIVIDDKPNSAWIIDGQHRCAGAAEAAKAGVDIDMPVIAFLGLSVQEQTDFFVTINKEAKGVPSSLYIDLLKNLPRKKTEKEILEERIADISREMNGNDESVFYQRIVSTTAPSASQISLTNLARTLRPTMQLGNGILSSYTLPEQIKIIENYFSAIKQVFTKHFDKNLFFKTLGFGAVWRAFPIVFSASLKEHGGFRVQDVANILSRVRDFDFDAWNKAGTGSAAEIQAGDDLRTEISSALALSSGDDGTSIRL